MDVGKTIEFILAHEAQISARHAELAEMQIATQKNLDELSASVKSHDEQIQAIAGAVHVLLRTRDEDRQLIERERLRAEQERVRMDALSDKIDQTTQNVNALVKIVDGMIRRDGGQIQ
jgi:ABC-type transporter Mla subunit MlaD